MKLDIHMLHMPDDSVDWQEWACGSVRAQGGTVRRVASIGTAAASRVAALYAAPVDAEYCTWVDSDDIITPGTLDAIDAAMQAQPGAGLYFTDEAFTDYLGLATQVQAPDRTVTQADIEADALTAHHLVVIRRDLLATLLPLVRTDRIGEGWQLAAGAAALAGFVHVRHLGYHWRQRPGSATRRASEHLTAADVAHVCDRLRAGQ